MDALNVASLTPLSVLSERKTELRKTPSNPTLSPPKVLNFSSLIRSPSLFQNCLSRNFNGSLALLSSVLSGSHANANALTYEEALNLSVSPNTPTPSGDFDPSSILDGLVGFATENPVVVAGGAAIFALPFVLSQVFGKPKAFGVESAKMAYSKLGDDATAQLLDIRPAKELREVGTPDCRGVGKKPVSVVYKGEDKNGFLKKLALKFKEPENTTLFILDK